MPRRKKGITVFNWMITLILSAIPGVNVIFFVLSLIFAKSRPKRTFAGAALILTVLFAAIIVAAFMIFGDEIVDFARRLNEIKA